MKTLQSSLLFILSFASYFIILLLGVSSHPLSSSSSPWPSPLAAPVSPWDQMDLFNLPFNVQAEEISDEEWVNMMTHDLRRHKVLPQIIDQVPPYVINVDYTDEHCVHLGNNLQPRHTLQQPLRISFPTNRSSNGNSSGKDSGSSGLFTLMAIDPDVPHSNRGNAGSFSQFLHWLVVNIPDEDIERGDVLAEYLGPLPSQQKQQGEHRFIFLAYRQPEEPIDVERVGLPHAEPCDWTIRARFSSSRFAQLYNLGRPVAVNYFVTQYDASVPQTIERCLIQRQSFGRLLSQHTSSSFSST